MMESESTTTYGRVQLRDLEDAAAAGGFGATMEARFAGDALGGEQMTVSLQRIKPAMRLDFSHRHRRDEETYVVVAGGGRALIEDRVVELRPWTALRVSPGAGHTFEADADGLELLVTRSRGGEDDSEFADLEWPAEPAG